MKVTIDSWADGAPIPTRFAFGKIPEEGRFALSDNINPAIAWSDAPDGTKSFVILCHDPDVPSSGDDVNQEGRTVPADLPRVDFFHWVVVNIPADVSGIAEGADSAGVTARGKSPGQQQQGQTGINSYTDWFADDPDMAGQYGGYDGPCPVERQAAASLPLHGLCTGCGSACAGGPLHGRRCACRHAGSRARTGNTCGHLQHEP